MIVDIYICVTVRYSFFRALVSSIEALSVLFFKDAFVHDSLKKINTVLGDLQTFLMVRFETGFGFLQTYV